MSRPKKERCQVCTNAESKYTCSKCMVLYCSVPCYKAHKETLCTSKSSSSAAAQQTLPLLKHESTSDNDNDEAPPHSDLDLEPPAPPLRPLTSLKWPYVPEESAYPNPLHRDDPKALQTHQYEAIATSPAIREALAANPRLPLLLTSIDKLRGEARESALQRALGVSEPDNRHTSAEITEEDIQSLRRLAEAVEAAVRGGKEDVLGLDWGDQ
ncbi:hypothetical protein BXZ70DRAFT_6247 [Cristinia sonorae]|uniref:HIT-type domain-containing protein n=1 Tax=Cristinia sonorae TaxID=1940300 RepID=A0A8K0XUS6_9AGAR|nr:hypothetical protein BXZ70DRAFT_6247 [Cristinia sonorae]